MQPSRPGKTSSSSGRRATKQHFPSLRWRITPASRSTFMWWLRVDGPTPTSNSPQGRSHAARRRAHPPNIASTEANKSADSVETSLRHLIGGGLMQMVTRSCGVTLCILLGIAAPRDCRAGEAAAQTGNAWEQKIEPEELRADF